jgi:hypothetical protein
MKQISLSILIFVFLSCNENQKNIEKDSSLPSENIIILDFPSFQDSTWMPSDEKINKTIKEIENFLNNPIVDNAYDSISVIKINQNIRNYTAQFKGKYSYGKKIILCNFFPTSDLKLINYDLKKIPHIVDDGKYFYWSIAYYINKNILFNFFANGKG